MAIPAKELKPRQLLTGSNTFGVQLVPVQSMKTRIGIAVQTQLGSAELWFYYFARPFADFSRRHKETPYTWDFPYRRLENINSFLRRR